MEAHRQAEIAWEEYWEATRPVELTGAVTAHAGELAGRHALRGPDAIHVASALAIGPDQLLFAVWDKRLRAAVETANIRLGPREVP